MRMDGRERVRRRLFADEQNGGTAHEGAAREMLDRELEVQSKRWNFDFRNEVPLEGPWQWEKVEANQSPRAVVTQEKEGGDAERVNEGERNEEQDNEEQDNEDGDKEESKEEDGAQR